MTTRQRLLMVMPYVPYPVDRGTYQRVYHLLLELAQRYRVDLVCLQEAGEGARPIAPLLAHVERGVGLPFRHPPWPKLVPERLFEPLPTTVRHWWDAEVLAGMEAFVAGQDYAVIYYMDLVLWPYIEKLFGGHRCIVMDRSRVDWLFQTEELNTLRLSLGERLLRKENLWKVARLERRVYGAIKSMIVCGPDDKTYLRNKLGTDKKIYVLANGYNPQYFAVKHYPRKTEAQPTLLFCGALDYTPNTDGIHWFAEKIWPKVRERVPEARWWIVGKSPGKVARACGALPGVELVGEVPDVREYYQRAWLQVVPLRIGGGTRLKIVESLAMECPVVSTRLGAQGLELAPGRDILLEDSEAGQAAAVVRLLSDREALLALAAAGRRAVEGQYTWGQLGGYLHTHLEGLL